MVFHKNETNSIQSFTTTYDGSNVHHSFHYKTNINGRVSICNQIHLCFFPPCLGIVFHDLCQPIDQNCRSWIVALWNDIFLSIVQFPNIQIEFHFIGSLKKPVEKQRTRFFWNTVLWHYWFCVGSKRWHTNFRKMSGCGVIKLRKCWPFECNNISIDSFTLRKCYVVG